MKKFFYLITLCLIFNNDVVSVSRDLFEKFKLFEWKLNQSKPLVELTSKIIRNVFNKKSNCLYYYPNNCNESFLVEEAFKKLQNVSLILFSTKNQENHSYHFPCEGYVIVSNNYDELQEILNNTCYIKTNTKILIFYNNYNDFNNEFYYNLTHLNGLDVIITEGYDVNAQELKVTSLRHNRTIFNGKEAILKEDEFVVDEWFPNFNFLGNNYTFKVSVFDCPPFIYYNKSIQKVFDGIEYRLLESIRPKLPLEFITHINIDGTALWSLNLMDVINGVSNVALCSQWQISVATRDMDMSLPYTQSCSTFLVPKPHLLPQSTYVFQPFHIQLWLFCYILSQFTGILFYVTTNLYKKIPFELGIEATYLKLGNALMHGIRIFTFGSTYMPPPLFGALRQMVVVASLAALLIQTVYSSGFTSSLTSPRYEKPINYITDMVEQLTYWGAREIDTLAVYNTTKNPYLQVINKRFVLETNDNDRKNRIIKDNYAFPINSLPNHYITETETLNQYAKTHLKILSECVGRFYLVFALKRNSPFTNLINKHIVRCNEHGLIIHWYSDIQSFGGWFYMDNFFATYVSTENTFKPLTFLRIQGIFIFLGIGYLVSIILFGLEIIYFNYKAIAFKILKKLWSKI